MQPTQIQRSTNNKDRYITILDKPEPNTLLIHKCLLLGGIRTGEVCKYIMGWRWNIMSGSVTDLLTRQLSAK